MQKIVHDSSGGGNILRFNWTVENCLKVSVGIDVYSLAKMIKYKVEIQQLLNMLTVVNIYYNNGT